MEITNKIKDVIKDPMSFLNEYSIIGLHLALIDYLDSLNIYVSKIVNITDELKDELEECYDCLKGFYLKYYMLIYRNSVVEVNSKLFQIPANAIHTIIKEDIVSSNILADDDGLEYYSYERDYKEVEEYLKFDCVERLQKIMESSNKEDGELKLDQVMDEEMLDIGIDGDQPPKKKRFRNEVREHTHFVANTKKTTNAENIDYTNLDEWDTEDMCDVEKVVLEFDSEDEDLEDITSEFNNLYSSDMKDFFKGSDKKVDLLELKTSDFLELFLPQNADKCSMHFFYEYLRILSLCDGNLIGEYTCENYCFKTIRFGLGKLVGGVDVQKKIRDYTLQDIYTILLTFTDQIHLLFKFTESVNNNKTLDEETTARTDVYVELVNYMNVIFKRLFAVINSNNEKYIDVPIFKCLLNNYKKKRTDVSVNTSALYYFSHAYRMIFSILQLDTFFLSEIKKNSKKEVMLYVKYRDYSKFDSKFTEQLKQLEDDFEKFMRKFKGKKYISNKCRWFTYKFCSSTLNRDWYIYNKFNSNESEQLATIDIIRDNSKIQRKVIETLEPAYEKWLIENWKKILIDITMISDKNKQDLENIEKLNKFLGDSIQGKNVPEDAYPEGLKMEFRNALGIYATHIWFLSAKGYRYWLFRFVVPFEAFIRYGYILLNLLLDDSDKIYREPLILQYGPFEYAVLSHKQLLYCGRDYFKALLLWLSEMETHCNSTILPIKSHGEMKNMDNYYPWIYMWKKIYFPKDFSIMNFMNSLSDDSLEIGDVFFEFEVEEKKEEKKVEEEVANTVVPEDIKQKMLDILKKNK
jgi:hypothetical protein